VDWSQLGKVALVTALLLAAWFVRAKNRGRLRFYVVFALAVTLSVQLVGVYLVFASLIIPALATRRSGSHRGLPAGYLLGTLAYTLGLALSAAYDFPAGPLIVWLLALIALSFNAVAAARRSSGKPKGDFLMNNKPRRAHPDSALPKLAASRVGR
jgi:zinc/manganese transport system permease protein